MLTRQAAVVVISFLLAANAPQDDPAKEELKKLQGTWQVQSVEAGGMPLKDIKLDKLIITGDQFGGLGSDLAIKLDPTRKPKEIDLIRKKDGRKWMGIYQLDGDTVKLCLALVQPGKVEDQKRPEDFDKNKAQMVITATRARP